MNQLYDLIKQVLQLFKLNEFEGVFYTLVLTVTVLLYKQFNNSIEKRYLRENEEVKSNLNIYSDIIQLIYRYRINDIDKQNLYIEIYKLLPICSNNLSKMILEININNDNEFKKISEQVIKEYNSLRFLDTSSISKSYSDDIFEFYQYQLKTSGFIKIFQAAFLSMLSLAAILIIVGFMYKYTVMNTIDKVTLLIYISSYIYYLMLLVINIQIICKKRFKKSIKYILLALLMVASPSIFIFKVNLVTSILFAVFIMLYTFVIFPKTVQKVDVFHM